MQTPSSAQQGFIPVQVRPRTTLGQLLKLTAAVVTGGEAKARIESGEVEVNGEVETRRGRKLQEDDRVEIGGRAFVIRVGCDAGRPGAPDQRP